MNTDQRPSLVDSNMYLIIFIWRGFFFQKARAFTHVDLKKLGRKGQIKNQLRFVFISIESTFDGLRRNPPIKKAACIIVFASGDKVFCSYLPHEGYFGGKRCCKFLTSTDPPQTKFSFVNQYPLRLTNDLQITNNTMAFLLQWNS